MISSGIYGYPKDVALQVASASIKEFLADHDMDVYLVIFDRSAFAVGKELLGAVESYIDENYIDDHSEKRRKLLAVEYKALNEATAPSFPKLRLGRLPRDWMLWWRNWTNPLTPRCSG